MVPGHCLSLKREQNQRADCGLQKETPAALHSSYDQWDPCGESKQLQVPRRKHLRGPDLDYTTSKHRSRKPGKDCTICDSWENSGSHQQSWKLLCRDHRKCSVSVHLSVVWKQLQQDCKALQRVVRLAERISGSALPSLQDIYIKRCRGRADKIIKDSNHPGNCLFTRLPSGKRFRCLMAKTERLRRIFFPTAIRLLNSKSAS